MLVLFDVMVILFLVLSLLLCTRSVKAGVQLQFVSLCVLCCTRSFTGVCAINYLDGKKNKKFTVSHQKPVGMSELLF